MTRLLAIISLGATMLLSSCSKFPIPGLDESFANIELKATPQLGSMKSWGVIKNSFVRVLLEPDLASSIVEIISVGELIEVLAIKNIEAADASQELWCKLRVHEHIGWVLFDAIKFLPNETEASMVSVLIKNKIN